MKTQVAMGLFGWLIVALAVVAMLWLPRRRGWTLTGWLYTSGRFLPASAPSLSRTARVVNAIVLGASAAILLAIAATWRNSGGWLLTYAVVGAAVAVLITLLGRTITGTITMAVVLIGYGLVPNDVTAGSWVSPKSVTEPVVEYTINISRSNLAGAELWVNGVFLGKTPYQTTLAEFVAKVPYWPEPPADYETDKVEIPQYDYLSLWNRSYRHWIKFELPNGPTGPMRPTREPETQPRQEQTTYYARVRYAGEWGLTGGGRGSGGDGGRLNYRAYSHFDVLFPERQKRLNALLNQARLADYRVGPDWFRAIETFNEDGWIALRKAGDWEPGMMKMLDAWAAWRYGLDQVINSKTAWPVFEHICREADQQRQYLTPSVAGRAVELLSPKLPQERLLDRAFELIENTRSYGYFTWRMNGRLQFGYSLRPGGVDLGGDGSVLNGFSGGGSGAYELDLAGYPVAHAIWMLYETHPQVVQERIVPAIVCWQSQAGLKEPLLAAAYFAGPALDRFLLRQNWRADPDQMEWDDRIWLGSATVNKWFYLLAHLNDEAGRSFRRKHAEAMMVLADKFYGSGPSGLSEHIDFIFFDPWLAREYWPRFARLARQKSPLYALETQWRYLLKMGPAATAAMYVEAWKDTNIDLSDFQQSQSLLYQLAPDLQAEVIAGLVEQVENHPENLARVLKQQDYSQNRLVEIMKSFGHGSRVQTEAERLYHDLQQARPKEIERLRENVPLWLAHTQPDSPLVKMLAASDDPDFRLMVMGVLREYPTPDYQRLLQRLLVDPASDVREAAQEVESRLQTLAAESPSRNASDVPDATTMPSSPRNP